MLIKTNYCWLWVVPEYFMGWIYYRCWHTWNQRRSGWAFQFKLNAQEHNYPASYTGVEIVSPPLYLLGHELRDWLCVPELVTAPHAAECRERGHGYWAGMGRTSGLAGWALGWSCCAGHQVALHGAATALSSCRAQQLRSVPALSSPGILEKCCLYRHWLHFQGLSLVQHQPIRCCHV